MQATDTSVSGSRRLARRLRAMLPVSHYGSPTAVDRNGHRRRGQMLAVGALLGVLATLCVLPASASAYKTINEHCILRVTEPEPQGGGAFKFGGRVDCTSYGPVWSTLIVCAQVENTSNHKWYEISGSCVYNYEWEWEANNRLSNSHAGNCGVNYRTTDSASVAHGTRASGPTTGWGSAEEISRPVKDTC